MAGISVLITSSIWLIAACSPTEAEEKITIEEQNAIFKILKKIEKSHDLQVFDDDDLPLRLNTDQTSLQPSEEIDAKTPNPNQEILKDEECNDEKNNS